MEQSLCLSNPYATGNRLYAFCKISVKVSMPVGSKGTLESVSSTRSRSVSSPDGNATCSVVSRSPFVHLLRSRKVTFKSVLLLSVAVVALLAVWGALSTLSIFYALPGSLSKGLVS